MPSAARLMTSATVSPCSRTRSTLLGSVRGSGWVVGKNVRPLTVITSTKGSRDESEGLRDHFDRWMDAVSRADVESIVDASRHARTRATTAAARGEAAGAETPLGPASSNSSTSAGCAAELARRSRIGARKRSSAAASRTFTSTSPTAPVARLQLFDLDAVVVEELVVAEDRAAVVGRLRHLRLPVGADEQRRLGQSPLGHWEELMA